jgi:hypothetical protein
MITYLIALIPIGYTYYKYKNNYNENKKQISINLSDKYEIFKKKNLNKKERISKELEIIITKRKHFLSWKNSINNVNNEFYKDIYLENNITKLKKYNIVIFNLKSIYDDENDCLFDKNFLENLSKYCYKNKIIFVIISEFSPNKFKNFEPKFFNKNNYFSPFNYKNKMFGSIQKLEINKISNKPANITINRIILDIMNRYGYSKEKIIYIDNQELAHMNNFKINFD